MKKIIIALMTMVMLCPSVMAKKEKKPVQYNEKGEIIKTGINIGPLPVVAFDADRGFQFGALLNIYNFGNGANYPNPNAQWYLEASAYVKDSRIGSYKLVANYDNKTLIPGVRMSICTGYYKDAALDFYGFNGYQSNYDMNLLTGLKKDGKDMVQTYPGDAPYYGSYRFDEDKSGTKLYNKLDGEKHKAPKGFYRHGRDLVKAKIDFTGEILKNFYWEAGYNFSWTKTQSFVPKGYSVLDNPALLAHNGMYVPGGTTLFDLYKTWGIISENEADGGFISALKVGLMYDSRNVENNPTKGIWAEGHIIAAPKWLGTTHEHYRYSLSMRQYVPIVPEKLTFAYRLAYQGTIGKKAPWYATPFYTTMGIKPDYDGFGGYRTVRGLMLNRVQGLDVGFYNIEFRYKFVEFKLWKQNIAFALSAFTDGAHVFRGYDMNFSDTAKQKILTDNPLTGPAQLALYEGLYDRFVFDRKDGFHGSAGLGLRFIMNQNFIVAFEGAQCFNKQDGGFAFYLNTGFLF